MSSDSTTTTTSAPPSEAVLQLVIVYGIIFILLFSLFCLRIRRNKPLFSPRSCIPELNNPVAEHEYAYLSWIKPVIAVNDDEMFDYAGLDSIVFVRFLQLGLKVSLLASANAIWLIPVYATAPPPPSDQVPPNTTWDEMDTWTVGYLSKNSPRMWATVVATYIVFIYATVLIYQEFDWFIRKRHQYMQRLEVHNYTLVLGGIPRELRSNEALTKYFNELCGEDTVYEVLLALELKTLEKKVEKRAGLIPNLEHASNVFRQTGKRPQHKTKLCGGVKVDSIDTYTAELDKLNAEIADMIDALDKAPPLRPGACITFRSLRACMVALQLVHDPKPFAMCARQAPDPKKVYWANLGMPHAKEEAGKLASLVLTIVLCLLWTVPVAAIAAAAQPAELKKMLPFLEQASDAWAGFDNLLKLVAPLVLVILMSLLPMILMFFAKLEGHISLGALQGSLLGKLTLFTLVQVFFVSAVAGSLFSSIQALAIDPIGTLSNVLATSLPGQYAYFIGYVLVKSCFGLGLELVRVVPQLLAWIRGKLGPKLTEREKRSTWLGVFAPLTTPATLDVIPDMSHMVLCFMIVFVYAVLAPITALFLVFVFGMMALVYRRQFLFVYDGCTVDTGGEFFPKTMRYILVCLILSELVVLVVLALKEAPAPSALVAPLMIYTILFWVYLEKQHFAVAVRLPSSVCVEVDKERHAEDLAFTKHYKQDALCDRVVLPQLDDPLLNPPPSATPNELNDPETAAERNMSIQAVTVVDGNNPKVFVHSHNTELAKV